MLQTRGKLTKLRVAASATLVIAAVGVGVASSVLPALALTTPLPTSAVNQQAGTVTGSAAPAGTPGGPFGVVFTNNTAVGAPFPASVGDNVSVTFLVVKTAAGTPVVADGAVPGSGGYLATFCGNMTDTGNPATDVPLTGADVGGLAGILAHCAPFTPVISAGGNLVVNRSLNGVVPFTPAVAPVAAIPEVVGVTGAVAGSISALVPAVPCDPLVAIPATLFTPLVPACSISPGSAAVPANPPADIAAVTAVPAVPAVLAAPAVPGTRCASNGTVIPCLMIVAALDQSVALALPVVNASAAQVVGRSSLVTTGHCNPVAAPPTGCAATRVGQLLLPPAVPSPTPTYPIVVAGGGFAPGLPVSIEAVCNNALGAGCIAGSVIPLGPITASATGGFQGAVQIVDVPIPAVTADPLALPPVVGSPAIPTVTPGNKFLRVTNAAGQIHYAPIRIEAAAPKAPVVVVGATPADGLTITGHDFEPRAHVSLQRLDSLGTNVGAADVAEVDGVGDLAFNYASAFTLPAFGQVKITSVDAAFGAPTQTFTINFVNPFAGNFCADAVACNMGSVITASVLPGSVQLYGGAEGATAALNPADLSTIDIQDPLTWYPVSVPAPMSQVLVGDFRGANTGIVVTGASSDLIGAGLASDIIPAGDVWVSTQSCDPYVDAGVGNDPLGDVSAPVDDADPQADPGNSPLITDAVFCTVLPDATGRAGGIWQIDASLSIAGRPITAVDDYTGLLTLTVTGQ